MALDDAIKKALGVTLEPEAEKALVSSEAGDFIPKEYADEFIDLVREKNWCRQLFRTINMPTATFYIPKVSGDASVYYVSTEATAPTESKPTFAAAGSVKLEAVKLMGYAEVSNETDEDSRIAMMPIIKESFAQAMAAAEEQAIILGQYNAAFAATDPRSAFKGLCKLAADATQTVVADNVAPLLGDLGQEGVVEVHQLFLCSLHFSTDGLQLVQHSRHVASFFGKLVDGEGESLNRCSLFRVVDE